jgi:ferrous iron transport protein A
MQSLAQLARKTDAVIVSIDGPRSFRRRLMEMGLVPGTPIKLIEVAPLGDPIEIEVRTSRLSIRKAEAAQIRVEPKP